MRLFLAIDLPDNLKKLIDKKIDSLKKKYSHFNWVQYENFHITIFFFGERNDLSNIKKKIEKSIWNNFSFYLYSFNLDVFVNKKLIIYLNFKRERKIEDLAENIKNTFSEGLINYRKFIPHLTLARGPVSSKQQYFSLKKVLNKFRLNISFPVESITLFESIIDYHRKRPVYKKISSFSLQKND